MRCGSCDTYLLFLAKKRGMLAKYFSFLGKVGVGGQRKNEGIRRESEG